MNEHHPSHQAHNDVRSLPTEQTTAYAIWARQHAGDSSPSERASRFRDAYIGHFESAEAWAAEVLAINGVHDSLADHLPAWLHTHLRFDLAGIVRDLSHDVHIEPSSDGGVYLFDARV